MATRSRGEYKTIESRAKAKLAFKLADNRKAEDLVILDMRKLSNFCDYFVIVSGNSDTQVEAIADAVREGFLEKSIRAVTSSGRRSGSWVLLDYGDVVIHVFEKSLRDYYNLDKLWLDAPKVKPPKSEKPVKRK